MKLKRTIYPLLPLVILAHGLASLAQAQFVQQGPKLTDPAAPPFALQGSSVALSADGNTAIVGAYFNGNGSGAVRVWIRSGGAWTQQGPPLVGSGAVGIANQGSAVALSADGNTALVGGDGAGAFGVPNCAVWVWTRSGGVWTQQGPKLVGDAAADSRLGFSVALSADGNTAIAGGPGDVNNTGAAWVWTRSGGVWTQQGLKLVGAGAIGQSYQGLSVAISADGNTALVGGPFDDGSTGAVWVWTRSGGAWTQQGPKLVAATAIGAQQGSVALSADGNTALIGGSSDTSGTGAVWVLTRNAGVWSQQGSKLVGSGAVGLASQGQSVALSADGNTALVGGPWDNNLMGAAWVYTRSGGVWSQSGSKLAGAGTVGIAEQGGSVALSADGRTAMIGGSFDNNYTGAAWVFVNQTATLPPILSATFNPSTIPRNGTATLAFTITNPLPNMASLISVGFSDMMPLGLAVATPAVVNNSCSGATLSAVPGSSLITLSGATIPAKSSCTFSVSVIGTVVGTLTNTTDPVMSSVGNGNRATANLTVNGADLTIRSTHTGNFAAGQTGATYTLLVTNSGVASTNGSVCVTDLLPVGLTMVSMSGSGWNCGAVPECSRADWLNAGATFPPLTVTVNVAQNAPVAVINQASMIVTGDDNPANNTAADPTVISGLTDVTAMVSVSSTIKGTTLTNISGSTIAAPIQLVIAGLPAAPAGTWISNATGTYNSNPYFTIWSSISPGGTLSVPVQFTGTYVMYYGSPRFTPVVYSGTF